MEEEQKYGHLTPGKISSALKKALGIRRNELPPYIYRMRRLGYPPGWLEEAKYFYSNLDLFDAEGNTVRQNMLRKDQGLNPEKIIEYPGFNTSMDKYIKDVSNDRIWNVFNLIYLYIYTRSVLKCLSQCYSVLSGSRHPSKQLLFARRTRSEQCFHSLKQSVYFLFLINCKLLTFDVIICYCRRRLYKAWIGINRDAAVFEPLIPHLFVYYPYILPQMLSSSSRYSLHKSFVV